MVQNAVAQVFVLQIELLGIAVVRGGADFVEASKKEKDSIES